MYVRFNAQNRVRACLVCMFTAGGVSHVFIKRFRHASGMTEMRLMLQAQNASWTPAWWSPQLSSAYSGAVHKTGAVTHSTCAYCNLERRHNERHTIRPNEINHLSTVTRQFRGVPWLIDGGDLGSALLPLIPTALHAGCNDRGCLGPSLRRICARQMG